MHHNTHGNAAMVAELFNAGLPYQQIGERLSMHRNTVRRHAHALGLKRGRGLWKGLVADRFWACVCPEPNSGCWLWDGIANSEGYGSLSIGGRDQQATHVSLMLAGRPVPNGKLACHHCDMPSCVNPDHLFIGTHADNAQDMIRKGRQRFHFGRAFP